MKKILAVFLLASAACTSLPEQNEDLVENLMRTEPDKFQAFLDNRDKLEIQIIYTMIDRDENNQPSFRSFYFYADSNRYFYPASTVKFPMSVLALEKLNQLQVEGLDKSTPMFHDSVYAGQLAVLKDTTAASGLPSIEHYIKKILTVSDNDAYNRLYEFMGQHEANALLNKRGYHARFLHRLERALSPDRNRHTEKIRFMRDGKIVFEQPGLFNTDSIAAPAYVLKGKGFIKNDSLVQKPFDFTYKNYFPLHDQQRLLRTILFPESVEADKRFNLASADYQFLYQYMSQLPAETSYPPFYQDTSYYDAYCKFLLFGNDRKPIPDHIRIFNKIGDAYGFMIDNAYVVDFKNSVEFMLSAVINVNVDEIYNDGEYAYDSLGYPFMKNLGQLVYNYELKRPRQHKPDLSKFEMKYDRPKQ